MALASCSPGSAIPPPAVGCPQPLKRPMHTWVGARGPGASAELAADRRGVPAAEAEGDHAPEGVEEEGVGGRVVGTPTGGCPVTVFPSSSGGGGVLWPLSFFRASACGCKVPLS